MREGHMYQAVVPSVVELGRVVEVEPEFIRFGGSVPPLAGHLGVSGEEGPVGLVHGALGRVGVLASGVLVDPHELVG